MSHYVKFTYQRARADLAPSGNHRLAFENGFHERISSRHDG
jgi:hypothetical protein